MTTWEKQLSLESTPSLGKICMALAAYEYYRQANLYFSLEMFSRSNKPVKRL